MDIKEFDYLLTDKVFIKENFINYDYLSLLKTNEKKIEEIWNEEQEKKRKNLFNGKILNLVKINMEDKKTQLECHSIEYKHYLAQRNGVELGISPLAVSGIVYYSKNGEDTFLLGKRSNEVTQYPGYYEFVPSGSIDTESSINNESIDYTKQLIVELNEEAGIKIDQISTINAFCLIFDKKDKVYDIGLEIKLRDYCPTIISKSEYTNMQFFDKTYIEQLFKNDQKVVNTSIALFKAWKVKIQGTAI